MRSCFSCLWKGRKGREEGVEATLAASLQPTSPPTLEPSAVAPLKAVFKATTLWLFVHCAMKIGKNESVLLSTRQHVPLTFPHWAPQPRGSQSHFMTDTTSVGFLLCTSPALQLYKWGFVA